MAKRTGQRSGAAFSDDRRRARNRDADRLAAAEPTTAVRAIIAWSESDSLLAAGDTDIEFLRAVVGEDIPGMLRAKGEDPDAAPSPVPALFRVAVRDAGGRIVSAVAAGKLIERAANTESAVEPGISILTRALEAAPRDVGRRHVITISDRGGEAELIRSPAVVDLAALSPVSAVEVDGEPVVSAGPAIMRFRRRAVPAAAQRAFRFAGPSELAGARVVDVVIASLSAVPLAGDERSPIRGDTYRLAALAYALSGAVTVPAAAGARFLGAADTETNRRRWWHAAAVFDALKLTVNERTGQWVTLGRAQAGPTHDDNVHLSAPDWWIGRGPGQAWRFAGAVWRRRLDSGVNRAGAAEFRSGLHRTVAGLEAALTWTVPTRGRNKGGRVAETLIATRPGGGGPARWFPWWQVLAFAGDFVKPNANPRGTEGRRYRRRVDALVEAGYLVSVNAGTAPAGDTIEIVEVVDGRGQGQTAGVRVRASARFCAAVRDRRWVRVPASKVLGGEG